jgi:hypothetical protein
MLKQHHDKDSANATLLNLGHHRLAHISLAQVHMKVCEGVDHDFVHVQGEFLVEVIRRRVIGILLHVLVSARLETNKVQTARFQNQPSSTRAHPSMLAWLELVQSQLRVRREHYTVFTN